MKKNKTYWATTLAKTYPLEPEAIRILQDLYVRMVFSSKRKTRPKKMQKFDLKKFIVWAIDNGYKQKFNTYLKKNREQKYKPSIDRLNPLKGYFFSNMQIITQEENFKKGYKEMSITQGRRVVQIDKKTNKPIKTYTSIMEASRQLNICDSCIRRNLKGNCNQAGGYKWEVAKGYQPKRQGYVR